MSGGAEVLPPRPRRQPAYADMTIVVLHLLVPPPRLEEASGDCAAVDLLALLRDPIVYRSLPRELGKVLYILGLSLSIGSTPVSRHLRTILTLKVQI